MKRIYNYILLPVFAFAAIGCMNEELYPESPSAASGDEVQFGLSLGDPKTKTIYGDETGAKFPIYWVNNDKVQIFSPQCLEGRRSAEYKITVPDGSQQNYANSLTRTGEAGVQWGENDNAIFYSLYPSGKYTLSEDGTKAEGVTINYIQNISVKGDVIKSDMEDCLMYAKNDGGKQNNNLGVPKGEVVNLTYSPISTVLYLTLHIGEIVDSKTEYFTIQSVKLTTPEEQSINIAGTFSLNIDDGTFGEFATGSSSILAQITDSETNGFYEMAEGESVSIPLFIAPVPDLDINGWKISVVTQNQTYVKTLNVSKKLEPGQIHKIVLPTITPQSSEWNPNTWMEQVPRNVYLSEVSIPGSWNSINGDYQSDPTIAGQYAVGVRAFHYDTRCRTDDKEVNLRGFLEGSINGLSVAGGSESDNFGSMDGGRVVDGNARTFAEYLKDITDNIIYDNAPRLEYMILMCTFAQDSYEYVDGDGNDWVGVISKACADNEYVYDAKKLTSDTVVGDVLGKVIVIVNMEGSFSTVPNNSKCLFVNLPLTLTSSMFGTTLNSYNSGSIYKAVVNSSDIADSAIDMYHTQAQISIAGEGTYSGQDRNNVKGRGFAPTFGERKTVANNILNWSKSNYGTDTYAHDKWIYLGLGGYYVFYHNATWTDWISEWREAEDGNENLAEDFNQWINGKVTEMGTTPSGQQQKIPYYPVGIALMNFVNDYSDVVENILILNNKYRLQFDPSKPSDYTPNLLSASEYGSSATHGGNAISLD